MAYLFASASSQRISAASAPVTAVPFTFACWFRPTTLVGRVLHFTNATTAAEVFVTLNGSGQCQASIRDDAFTTGSATTATTAATVGNWHHIAGVFASTTSRTAYLNGVASTVNTTALGTITAFTRFTIAARQVGSFDSFANGDIAEVGIWNAALSAAEIAGLAKGVTPARVRAGNLVHELRLIRTIQDLRRGLVMTNTNGATVSPHPRIFG